MFIFCSSDYFIIIDQPDRFRIPQLSFAVIKSYLGSNITVLKIELGWAPQHRFIQIEQHRMSKTFIFHTPYSCRTQIVTRFWYEEPAFSHLSGTWTLVTNQNKSGHAMENGKGKFS